jgi:hypothetical protein
MSPAPAIILKSIECMPALLPRMMPISRIITVCEANAGEVTPPVNNAPNVAMVQMITEKTMLVALTNPRFIRIMVVEAMMSAPLTINRLSRI